jgi:hypothetical protein
MMAAAAENPEAQVEVFDMRVVPSTGLLYLSKAPLRQSGKSLGSGPAQSTPGERGAQLLPAAPDSSRRATKLGPAGQKGGGGISHTAWHEVHEQQGYPMTAVGFVDSTIRSSLQPRCSGSLIGKQAVVTAAVRHREGLLASVDADGGLNDGRAFFIIGPLLC